MIKRELSKSNSQYNLATILFFLYLVLKPFYFWKSGVPQISDLMLIFILMPLVLMQRGLNLIKINRKNQTTFLLFLLSLTVDLILSFFSENYKFLINPFYFLFSFVFLLIIEGLENLNYKSFIIKSIPFNFFIQLIFVIKDYGIKYRSVGTFNNPNQLAYNVLLNIILYYLLTDNGKNYINKRQFILVNILGTILMIMSLSNSGIISLILFYSLVTIYETRNFRIVFKIAIYVMISIGLMYIVYKLFPKQLEDIFIKLTSRLQKTNQKISNSSEIRGYNRIVLFPKYILFGAGSGMLERFSKPTFEIHSSYAYMLFNYGIFGFVIYISDIIYILRKNLRYFIMYIMPILLYVFGHNGLRQPLYWLITYILLSEVKKEEKVINNENKII